MRVSKPIFEKVKNPAKMIIEVDPDFKVSVMLHRWPRYDTRPISFHGNGFYRLVWPDGEPNEKVWTKIEETYKAVAKHSEIGNCVWVDEAEIS